MVDTYFMTSFLSHMPRTFKAEQSLELWFTSHRRNYIILSSTLLSSTTRKINMYICTHTPDAHNEALNDNYLQFSSFLIWSIKTILIMSKTSF